jgi:translation initiation factor 1
MTQCTCRRSAPAPRGDGIVRVGRETKGRKGNGVTVVTGLPLGGAELAETASQLKRRCGSGGTVKDGVIEIQGDHRDLLVQELGKLGYTVRKSGG